MHRGYLRTQQLIFFRGLLVFAFDQAFRGRVHFLGVKWGWGAVLSSIAFGLVHAGAWCDVGRPDCIPLAEELLGG